MISGLDLRLLPIFILAMGCAGGSGKLIGLSAVAFIIEYLWNGKKGHTLDFAKSEIVQQSFIAIGFFLGMQLLAALFSPDMKGIKEIFDYLERLGAFLLVAFFARGEKSFFKAAFFGGCIGMLITCGSAWQDYFMHAELSNYRPTGTVGNPNQLGAHFTLTLPLLILGFHFFKGMWQRILVLLVILFTITTLNIADSRGAIGSVLILSIITVFIYLLGKLNFSFKKNMALVLSALLITGLAFNLYYNNPNGRRGYDTERYYLRAAGVAMFLDHPIVGVGFGNFNEIYREHYISPNAHNPSLQTAHNIYLHYLDESGIVGFIGFAGLVFFQLGTLCKAVFKSSYPQSVRIGLYGVLMGIIAMLIHGYVDTVALDRDYIRVYWFVWGMTCYSIYLVKKQEQ